MRRWIVARYMDLLGVALIVAGAAGWISSEDMPGAFDKATASIARLAARLGLYDDAVEIGTVELTPPKIGGAE